jgi:acyl homoserine lactone synthase
MKPLIKVAGRDAFRQDELRELFRFRAKIFHDRLNWDVRVLDGMEVDGYDALEPRYLTIRNGDRAIIGCWRLLSTEGPYMLKNSFAHLLSGMPAPSAPDIWELSRFALEGGSAAGQFGFSNIAVEAIAAVLSYGYHAGIVRYITVTTPVVERMLRRLGIVTERFTQIDSVGPTSPLALWVDIVESHRRLGSALAVVTRDQVGSTDKRATDAGNLSTRDRWTKGKPADQSTFEHDGPLFQ